MADSHVSAARDWRMWLVGVVGAVLSVLIVGSAWLDQSRHTDVRSHSDARWNDLSGRMDSLEKACKPQGVK